MTSSLEPFHVGSEPYTALNSRKLFQLTDDLNLYGLVLISNLVTRSNAQAAADRILDIMRQQSDSGKPDQHLPDFLDHLDPSDYPLFAEMLAHPICLGIARSVLGTGFQLTEPGARWRKPGAQAGPIHASAPLEKFATEGLPVPNSSFVLGFSWMLNDLKADMGATAYLPFSHRAVRYPGPNSGRQYLIPIEAQSSDLPSGTVAWLCR